MRVTRRTVMGQALALAGLGALPIRRAWAQTEMEAAGGRLITLSDGHLVLPEGMVLAGLPDEAKAILEAAGLAGPELQAPCNLTLWQRDGATVLFDAGAGPDFMPSAGKLPDALAAARIDPADVTHVIFTHGHPDHLWGVLDDFDEPVFVNASHHMGAEEHAYWMDPATADTIGADRQAFAAGALRRLEILGNAVATFGNGEELLPGIVARLTPGHTPGHMSFALGEATVIGDAVANAHVALARPDWELAMDQDPPRSAATRSALLAELAASGAPVIGFHFPGGGIGRIAAEGGGFRFAAAT